MEILLFSNSWEGFFSVIQVIQPNKNRQVFLLESNQKNPALFLAICPRTGQIIHMPLFQGLTKYQLHKK